MEQPCETYRKRSKAKRNTLMNNKKRKKHPAESRNELQVYFQTNEEKTAHEKTTQ